MLFDDRRLRACLGVMMMVVGLLLVLYNFTNAGAEPVLLKMYPNKLHWPLTAFFVSAEVPVPT